MDYPFSSLRVSAPIHWRKLWLPIAIGVATISGSSLVVLPLRDERNMYE
jgi:hypothetical protein